MEKLDIISKITHKGNDYYILLDEKYNKYYLKLVDHKFDYINFNEFMELNKRYNVASLNIGARSLDLKVKPMIKHKDKLISFKSACKFLYTLSGCIDNDISCLEEYGVSISDGIRSDDGIYLLEGINTHKKKPSFIDCSAFLNYNFNHYVNPVNFQKMMHLDNVSWNDIYDVINKNNNINEDVKDILIDGVTNLKNNNFKINLSVLYYNLKRLKVNYKSDAFMNGKAGYFNHITCNAILNENLNDSGKETLKKLTIIHEILGHGSTEAYTNTNGGVLCGVAAYYLNTDENKVTGSGTLGLFSMEAIAEVITCNATNEKMSTSDGGYLVEMYVLQNLCASNGISLEEFANNGINYLIDKMVATGISDPLRLIMTLDTTYIAFSNGDMVEVDNSLVSILINYYKEILEILNKENNIEYVAGKEKIFNWLKMSEKGINLEKIKDYLYIYNVNKNKGSLVIAPDLINQYIDEYVNVKNTI